MRSIPISATNSTLIVRAQKVVPITIGVTYSLQFTDFNTQTIIRATGVDISTNPFIYNEFLIDNTQIGLGLGQHNLDVLVQDMVVWRGIVDGDGYTLQIPEFELQGIAHNLLAGRDDGLVAVAELEVLRRLGIDVGGILGMSDVDRSDLYGLHRIDVAQLEADHVASYANLYHLAYRTVSHAIVIGHK